MTDELAARCARAVHVLGPDGTFLSGGRASLFVLERIGWPRLGRILRRRPLVWLVEGGYRVVAANRGWLSRLLPRGGGRGGGDVSLAILAAALGILSLLCFGSG